MLRLRAVDVGTCPASALPPMLAELQDHLGVDAALVDAVTSADRFVVFSQDWKPAWPPVHEIAARFADVPTSAADRALRQYQLAEPENRLVIRQLEAG